MLVNAKQRQLRKHGELDIYSIKSQNALQSLERTILKEIMILEVNTL
jgi:hypothetical protein